MSPKAVAGIKVINTVKTNTGTTNTSIHNTSSANFISYQIIQIIHTDLTFVTPQAFSPSTVPQHTPLIHWRIASKKSQSS
jgi:hypothetical protein